MKNKTFRAKQLGTNEWVVGYYARVSEGDDTKHIILPIGGNLIALEVDGDTVTKFICTNNGVDIFEEDLLQYELPFENTDDKFMKATIKWNDRELKYELISSNSSHNPPINWLPNFNKVGNSFDNS